MAKQKAKAKDNESNRVTFDKKNSPIRIVANWQHTQETTPAFKRLMMLLLQPPDNQRIEISRADEEHENEHPSRLCSDT